MLDRGERDDWLESHFIAAFLAIAVVAIAIAIWWEWRHDDPVVELTLLRERNFAIANVYYFLFAFGLFGSTVLIPEMLQTLFGYTATDAGLVLGPGAAVITLLAPFVVRIVPRIGAKRLLARKLYDRRALIFLLQRADDRDRLFPFHAGAMLSGFRLRVHVRSGEPARVLVSAEEQEQQRVEPDQPLPQLGRQLRYRVRHHDAGAADAVSSERAGKQLTSADGTVRQFVNTSSHYLVTRGASTPDAIHQAYGLVGSMMTQQATMLAFMDCFRLLGLIV